MAGFLEGDRCTPAPTLQRPGGEGWSHLYRCASGRAGRRGEKMMDRKKVHRLPGSYPAADGEDPTCTGYLPASQKG